MKNLTRSWSNVDRLEFLKSLDGDEEHEVTNWEAGFIDSCLRFNESRSYPSFSDKQKQVIENLVQKYEPTRQPSNADAPDGRLFDSAQRFEKTVREPKRKSDKYDDSDSSDD